MFEVAATAKGYNSFPRPTANASKAYTNPDGAKFGECQYCGHCERFGCEANAKGGAHMTVIPAALKQKTFELRTNTWVTKVITDSTGTKATGVQYTHVLTGEEYFQPAQMVILCAFSFNNVHLLLKFLFVVESHFVFGNSSFSETSEVLHLILTFGFLIDMFGAKRTDCFRHKIEFLQKSLYALAWDCAIGKPVSHSVLVYRNLPGNSLTLNRSPNTQML
jgi:hypothetical protein